MTALRPYLTALIALVAVVDSFARRDPVAFALGIALGALAFAELRHH